MRERRLEAVGGSKVKPASRAKLKTSLLNVATLSAKTAKSIKRRNRNEMKRNASDLKARSERSSSAAGDMKLAKTT